MTIFHSTILALKSATTSSAGPTIPLLSPTTLLPPSVPRTEMLFSASLFFSPSQGRTTSFSLLSGQGASPETLPSMSDTTIGTFLLLHELLRTTAGPSGVMTNGFCGSWSRYNPGNASGPTGVEMTGTRTVVWDEARETACSAAQEEWGPPAGLARKTTRGPNFAPGGG